MLNKKKFNPNKTYKIGDVVTIIDNLEDRHIHNEDVGINEKMQAYSGLKLEISNIIEAGSSNFKIYRLLDTSIEYFNWSSNMFKESYEEIVEEATNIIPLPTFYKEENIRLESFHIFDNYREYISPGFLTPDKTFLILFKENKKIEIINQVEKRNNWFIKRINPLSEKDIKFFILNHCKVRIKDYKKSGSLFGYNTIKKKMFEENNIIWNKDSKELQKKEFKMSKIIFNYSKNNEIFHVIELFSPNNLSIKFTIEDLELVPLNLNSITLPKRIKFNKGTECKIIKKTNRYIKTLPIENTKEIIKIIDLYNNHTPEKNKTFDKNTIAICKTKDNLQFKCKLKILKPISDDYNKKVY